MSGALLSLDGRFGWWVAVVVVVGLIVLVRAFERWWMRREARIYGGPAFRREVSEGESVFDICRAEPKDELGHGFEFESTGGFRRGSRR